MSKHVLVDEESAKMIVEMSKRMSLRILTKDTVSDEVLIEVAKFMREKRKQGMGFEISKRMITIIEDMCRLGIFADLFVRLLDKKAVLITEIHALETVLLDRHHPDVEHALQKKLAEKMARLNEKAS